ncbi:hypothetical protein D3C79_456930 [compost metagenome]
MSNQLALDVRRLRQAHVKHQRLLPGGQRRPVQPAVALGVAGHQSHALRMVAMGEGNAAVGRTAGGGGNTRYHRERDVGIGQGFQLFAATTENKRVTAFQPDYAFALLRLLQQDAVDLLLRYAMMAGALADEDTFGITAYQRHDFIGHQPIVNHYVGLLDLLQTLESQQTGVPRPGTHQHHFAGLLRRAVEQLFYLSFRQYRVIIGQRLRQPVMGKQLFPKTTAGARAGKVPFHPLAQ